MNKQYISLKSSQTLKEQKKKERSLFSGSVRARVWGYVCVCVCEREREKEKGGEIKCLPVI